MVYYEVLISKEFSLISLEKFEPIEFYVLAVLLSLKSMNYFTADFPTFLGIFLVVESSISLSL